MTGTKGFKGTYTIERFVAQGRQARRRRHAQGQAGAASTVTKENVAHARVAAGNARDRRSHVAACRRSRRRLPDPQPRRSARST